MKQADELFVRDQYDTPCTASWSSGSHDTADPQWTRRHCCRGVAAHLSGTRWHPSRRACRNPALLVGFRRHRPGDTFLRLSLGTLDWEAMGLDPQRLRRSYWNYLGNSDVSTGSRGRIWADLEPFDSYPNRPICHRTRLLEYEKCSSLLRANERICCDEPILSSAGRPALCGSTSATLSATRRPATARRPAAILRTGTFTTTNALGNHRLR